MNEFAFFDLKSSYVVKSNAVRSFFWRIYGALSGLRFYLTFKDATVFLGPREFSWQSKFSKRFVSCRNSKSFSFYGEILGKTSICKLETPRLFQQFTSNESMHDQFRILNFNGFCLPNQNASFKIIQKIKTQRFSG